MSLRFLDSKDGPIASKLAPFAQSYDVCQKQLWRRVRQIRIDNALICSMHTFKGGNLTCSRSVPKAPPFRNQQNCYWPQIPLQSAGRNSVLVGPRSGQRVEGDVDGVDDQR